MIAIQYTVSFAVHSGDSSYGRIDFSEAISRVGSAGSISTSNDEGFSAVVIFEEESEAAAQAKWDKIVMLADKKMAKEAPPIMGEWSETEVNVIA